MASDLSAVACALCHKKGPRPSQQGAFLPPLTHGGKLRYVHRACAEFSPQTPTLGLLVELQRGSKISCAHCGKRGATIGCEPGHCPRSYHLHCAARAGARLDVGRALQGLGGLFCRDHLYVEGSGPVTQLCVQ